MRCEQRAVYMLLIISAAVLGDVAVLAGSHQIDHGFEAMV